MKTQTDGRRPQPKPGEPKKAPRLKAVRLEPRIAPRRGPCDDDWGCGGNHNETLARDAQAKPAGAKPKKASRLRAVPLEPRLAPGTSYQHNETLVREPAKAKAPKARKGHLRATRLEGRVAPGVSLNHNETLVREPAEVKPPAPAARPEPRRSKLHIRKLEERIAPRSGRCEEWGCGMNHNETLVREPAKAEAKAPVPARETGPKAKLKVLKLEERIAPRRGACDDEWGCGSNHNETLVRDRA